MPSAAPDVYTNKEPAEKEPENTDGTTIGKGENNMKWFPKPDPFDVALWGLLVAFGVGCIYYLQLRSMQKQQTSMQDQVTEMQKQTAEVRRQTEISQRPSLSADLTPSSDLLFINGQAVMNIKFSIRNVGHSLAKDMWISAKFLTSKPLGIPIAMEAGTRQAELCDHPQVPGIGRVDLFPSDHPIEQTLSISVSKAAMDAVALTLQGTSREFVSFDAVGCVNYRSSFSADLHQTFFAYHLIGPWITKPPSKLPMVLNGIGLGEAFEVGVTIPNGKFAFNQELMARNDAT